jgi:hypothetical protein
MTLDIIDVAVGTAVVDDDDEGGGGGGGGGATYLAGM